MTQKEIYKLLVLNYPHYSKYVDRWFPNGKNSIRIRQINQQEFIFTYNDKKDWKFETLDSFLKSLNTQNRKDRKEILND